MTALSRSAGRVVDACLPSWTAPRLSQPAGEVALDQSGSATLTQEQAAQRLRQRLTCRPSGAMPRFNVGDGRLEQSIWQPAFGPAQ